MIFVFLFLGKQKSVSFRQVEFEIFIRPLGFPGGSDGKASACNAGDPGSLPVSGRCPGGGNDQLGQVSGTGSVCLPPDRSSKAG